MNGSGAVSRADLHIHSKYSDRPSEWFLRRIGAPESFVEPAEVYRRCRAAGMDYVTISDHNCIRGALEIAHLPGVFLSAELTTYFPEDRCKIHCLVSGINERQFDELQLLRQDIYALRAYLLEHNIVHTIAHPLFRVNDRLTVDHFEKLLVMFNRFEGINGSRDGRACRVAHALMDALDAERLAALADKHGLTPHGRTPWRKQLTGGSDDHGGLYGATAYTVTPHADSVEEFINHLRAGRHEPGGTDGSSLKLAGSLVHIAHAYIKARLGGSGGSGLLHTLFKNLVGQVGAEETTPVGPFRAAARRLADPIVRRHKLRQLSETERLLIEQFRAIVAEQRAASETDRDDHIQRYELVARLAHQLSYAFLGRCVEKLRVGSLMGAVQSLASLSPIALGVSPFVAAFAAQHKDNAFLRELCAVHPAGRGPLRGRGGKAWITDTFSDVNGVAKTIRVLASLANATGRPMTVLTSLNEPLDVDFPAHNFAPVGTFALPEYPELTFAVPPVLDIVRYIEERDFDELLISTPGPMGLAALLAARLLGIPAKGIYHTDFPHYIEKWTEDESMGEATRRYMRWFYGRMETIYAPTRAYIFELERLGFERERLSVLPRGVDPGVFNPNFRSEGFWDRHGLNGSDFKFIYVGRVSSEKNIDVLIDAFRLLRAEGHSVELAIVGDGPELPRLRAACADLSGIAFAGYLHGEALATAYASSDALAFPSVSDTFGNVVLEAHASGLPAVVSDRGGPREIVEARGSGLVTPADRAEAFAEAMRTLMLDGPRYRRCRAAALSLAADSRWDDVLDILYLNKIVVPRSTGGDASRMNPLTADCSNPPVLVS